MAELRKPGLGGIRQKNLQKIDPVRDISTKEYLNLSCIIEARA
jgi:hypothetical protein